MMNDGNSEYSSGKHDLIQHVKSPAVQRAGRLRNTMVQGILPPIITEWLRDPQEPLSDAEAAWKFHQASLINVSLRWLIHDKVSPDALGQYPAYKDDLRMFPSLYSELAPIVSVIARPKATGAEHDAWMRAIVDRHSELSLAVPPDVRQAQYEKPYYDEHVLPKRIAWRASEKALLYYWRERHSAEIIDRLFTPEGHLAVSRDFCRNIGSHACIALLPASDTEVERSLEQTDC